MSRFEYHEPASIADAVGLGARHGDAGRFLAGGTDLLVQLERGRLAPRHVIGLGRLSELATLEVEGTIRMGARVTHRTIERTRAFGGRLRALIEAAQVIGGHQVRNVATVGGNIVNASPAADLVPVLMTLDAVVHLIGPEGERRMALDAFGVGPGRTAMRPGELLTRVTLESPPPHSATAFLKAGRRKAMEISVVCVAARLTLDPSRERCLEAWIALGAVAPTAVRARAAERVLEGEPLEPARLRRAAEAALAACDPIGDVRASARFRRHLVVTLVQRALEACVARAGEAA
jgi:carbon-monoxide dehydrogenase medium subunit